MVYTCIISQVKEPQLVAYRVRKGTSIVVRKPSGEVVGHRCRGDCLFQVYKKLAEHKTLPFGRDGFLVTVDAANMVEVRYRCPQCGEERGGEGLCERCRASWRPKR